MPHKLLPLTDEQKALIRELYPKDDLGLVARKVFNNPDATGQTTEGLTVKAFLAGEGLVSGVQPLKTTATPLGRTMLDDNQRKQIEELSGKIDNLLEISRIVYHDPNLKQLSKEYRAVYNYYKSVYPKGIDATEELVDEEEFNPPTTMPALIGLVNDCVPSGDARRTYNWGSLKVGEERQLRRLMSYLRGMLFRCKAYELKKKMDRNLYVSTFVRYTHDKPDLTPEEVDQYVMASAETVTILQIERDLRRIGTTIEEVMNGDRESRGQFMPLVELINTTRSKLDQSKGRLDTLIDNLVGTRNKRLKDRDTRNSSILNMFDAWVKDEQKRNDMIEMGISEHEEDKREVGRIKSIDDLSTLIAGQTEDEAAAG